MIDVCGPRVRLRTMTLEEFRQYRREYVPDPVMDPGPYAYSREEADAAYARYTREEAWYPRVGIFLADGQIIGSLSFKRIDREKGRCELGVALSRDAYKGKGYGGEAFGLAVSYAFEGLGLSMVYADTMGSNLRMQRVLDACGFRCFLRLEQAYDMGDRLEDRLDYVLTREAYEAGKGAGG